MDIERQVHDLAARVAALEAALLGSPTTQQPAQQPRPPYQEATATTSPPPPAGVAPNHPPPPPAGAAPNYPPPVGPPVGVAPEQRPPFVFEWGIETVLRWAGVALVSLAAIFLVSTAISRGWIGPELQLFGATLAGAGLLYGAVRLFQSRRPWALAFGCGGAIVVTACALATHEWLDVVGPGPAVVLAGVATAISLAVALHTRLEGIALVAATAGMVAPIDTLDSFGDGAILAWVATFVVGASVLGWMKRWPGLRLITGWWGALILMVYALIEDAEGLLQAMGFIGVAIIGTALWAGPTLATRLAPSEGSGSWGTFDWTPLDYRLVALVPAWVWAVVAGLLPLVEDSDYGIVAIITAAGFIGLAEATFGRVERLVSISTFLGAFSLLAVGLAIFFEGPALMVALAGQAITSYYLARKLDDNLLRFGSYFVALISTGLALNEMIDAIDQDGFVNFGAALATGIIVLCWIGTAYATQKRGDLLDGPPELPLIGAWAGTMLWLAAVLIGVPQGLVLISAAWAVKACAGLIVGLTRRMSLVKNLALATLGITLAKLVTVDMAEVDVFWRVGLFFVVGIGLIMLGLKIPALIGPSAEGPEDDSVDSFDPSATTF